MRISDWSSDVCSSDLGPAVFDRLACHATADDVEIPDEIELAQLDAIAFDPAIVAHPVGQEMRQPGKTHDRIIISSMQAAVLPAAVVPGHALLWLGHPPGLGCENGPDLAAGPPALTNRTKVLYVRQAH